MTNPKDHKRLPRNATSSKPDSPFLPSSAVYSTSPQSYPNYQSFSQYPVLSPTSEVEVIMDDGTVQKRTVSLSTLPDVNEMKKVYLINMLIIFHSNNNYHSETSPLLIKKNPHQNYSNENINHHQPHYQSTTNTATANISTDDETDSDTTSDDEDSDDPFFPLLVVAIKRYLLYHHHHY
ncbi:unnamed protein product [Cunninghamella blakesleeana]